MVFFVLLAKVRSRLGVFVGEREDGPFVLILRSMIICLFGGGREARSPRKPVLLRWITLCISASTLLTGQESTIRILIPIRVVLDASPRGLNELSSSGRFMFLPPSECSSRPSFVVQVTYGPPEGLNCEPKTLQEQSERGVMGWAGNEKRGERWKQTNKR